MAKERNLSALDRLIAQAIGSERRLGNEDDPAVAEWPQLWSWLSTVYVGRDHVKTPAILSVRLGPACALCTLTDRDLSVSVDAAAPCLHGLFAAMEAQLASSILPIKSWGKKEPQLRKRKSGN